MTSSNNEPTPTINNPSLEELLGKSLLTAPKKSSATKSLLKNKEFVLLYFSASWCPPCRAFTPVLKEFYEKNKSVMEIVFLSSDQTAQDFETYYATMPWLAVAHEQGDVKRNLADLCKVRGIPCGIVLNAQGLYITNKGRECIQQPHINAIEDWRLCTPQPIEQGIANDTNDSGGSLLSKLFWGLLKNPMYIFGLLYIGKWVMRQMKSGDADLLANENAPLNEPIADDEF